MISLNLPMMQVRYTRGRQLCYKENICCLPQDVPSVAEHLPRMPEECDIVIIRREGVDMSKHVDFMVRGPKIYDALKYKIEHDPSYSHVCLDDPEVIRRLDSLPSHFASMADRIPTLVDQSPDEEAQDIPSSPSEAAVDSNAEGDDGQDDDPAMLGVLNLGQLQRDEVHEIRQETNDLLQHPTYDQQYIVRLTLYVQGN